MQYKSFLVNTITIIAQIMCTNWLPSVNKHRSYVRNNLKGVMLLKPLPAKYAIQSTQNIKIQYIKNSFVQIGSEYITVKHSRLYLLCSSHT